MSRYDEYDGFAPYVPVAERRARAAQAVQALRRRNPHINPVIIDGRKLARTWWGEAWNHNLERYADFANRIGRGRSYLRHGAVLDLVLVPGQAVSLVQGSQRQPYQVTVTIDALSSATWQSVTDACQGAIASLSDLVEGRFPKSWAQLFTAQGGLFPTPQEIHVQCSCPDWAVLCKHASAVLYGIGTRLDDDPRLFFTLRQVAVDDLISQAVTDRSESLLKKAGQKSQRVLDSSQADLSTLFGIDLDTD